MSKIDTGDLVSLLLAAGIATPKNIEVNFPKLEATDKCECRSVVMANISDKEAGVMFAAAHGGTFFYTFSRNPTESDPRQFAVAENPQAFLLGKRNIFAVMPEDVDNLIKRLSDIREWERSGKLPPDAVSRDEVKSVDAPCDDDMPLCSVTMQQLSADNRYRTHYTASTRPLYQPAKNAIEMSVTLETENEIADDRRKQIYLEVSQFMRDLVEKNADLLSTKDGGNDQQG